MSVLRDYGERGFHAGVRGLSGFQKFILRGNVVDLAVGVIIGAAFSGLVQGFVNDIIQPLLGLFGGKPTSFNDIKFGSFLVGHFVGLVISFLITAAVVYFLIVLPINSLRDRFTPHKDESPKTRDCPFCLSTVPLGATRCAYCTAQLPPVDEEPQNAQAAPSR
ncbi:MAG TPA: large conductance mechanosensitive channel protein MscL [Ktedonobacteraceae bacterium]|nr:large conductance mechanosensitive channel protein MscL [Ktedonobacteraceae bacterium]